MKKTLYGIFIRETAYELKVTPVPCWLFISEDQYPALPSGYCRFDSVVRTGQKDVRQQLIVAAQQKARRMTPKVQLTIGLPK